MLSKFSQEIWDEITSYLPCLSASNAARVFKFKLQAYDKVWDAVFQTNEWGDSAARKNADIVLIGADLDILGGTSKDSARPHLVLTVFDRAGDLQWKNDLLRSSLCETYDGPGEYELDRLTLTVGNFDVPEILGEDFRFLFSKNEEQLQTKFCYWKDPWKRIRAVNTCNIRGIGGVITKAVDLDPIFLLHLHPPEARWPDYFSASEITGVLPQQFIFRCFGGKSFRVGVMMGARMSTGEYVIDGFPFKDEKYEKQRHQNKTWMKITESESRQGCITINT